MCNMKSIILGYLGQSKLFFSGLFAMLMVAVLGAGSASAAPLAQVPTFEDILPATWTFDALAAGMSALLGLGLVAGIVFLVLTLRLTPKIVRMVKSLGR